MRRIFTLAIALVCLSMGAFMLPALSQVPNKAAPIPVVRASAEVLAIMRVLDEPIATSRLQKKVTLKKALEILQELTGGRLPMVVDREAFLDGMADRPDVYEDEVGLPPVPERTTVEKALRKLTAQIAKGGATFIIRKGWIEITTLDAWSCQTAASVLDRPSIVASYERRPLVEVLQDLSDRSEITIHLDPNVGEKANALISATFRNSTLEEALVIVTEMAKLKYAELEHSIYVTTPGNEKSMQHDEKARLKRWDGPMVPPDQTVGPSDPTVVPRRRRSDLIP
jgi:hypothetical protein